MSRQQAIDEGFCSTDETIPNVFGGWQSYAGLLVGATAVWVAIYFMVLLLIWPRCAEWVKKTPSKYAEEDSPHFFVSFFYSTINAVIAGMSFVPTIIMWTANDPFVQFARPTPEKAQPWTSQIQWLSLAGIVFTGYAFADLLVGIGFRFLKADMIAHHSILVLFSVIICLNCFAPGLVGGMLLMEFSTIPLNYFLYFRNRLGDDHWSIVVSFLSFAGTFFVFRICAIGYTAFLFFSAVFSGNDVFKGVVVWQLWIVCTGLVLIMLLQINWWLGIWKKMMSFGDRPDDQLPPVAVVIKKITCNCCGQTGRRRKDL